MWMGCAGAWKRWRAARSIWGRCSRIVIRSTISTALLKRCATASPVSAKPSLNYERAPGETYDGRETRDEETAPRFSGGGLDWTSSHGGGGEKRARGDRGDCRAVE